MRVPSIRPTVATIACLSAALVMGAACGAPDAAPPAEETAAAEMSDREKIVGTYARVTSEVRDEDGVWSPTPGEDRHGYITYSDRGYMAVSSRDNGRTKFAGDEPTPEEAQAAIASYSAYYGPYTVNEAEGFVVHHRVGQIDPGGEVDAKRFYDFVGDRLILTPAPAMGGKEDATRRIVWERLPDVELSDEARRFLGHRELLYTERYTARDGEIVERTEPNESRAGAVIIYTPTGHMIVQLPDREGRMPYAGEDPTPAEALAAFNSYGGYFGRFTVHEDEDPRYVIHHQEGRLSPETEHDAQRFYELDGDILRLGGPPQTTNGESTGGHLYWELMPPR